MITKQEAELIVAKILLAYYQTKVNNTLETFYTSDEVQSLAKYTQSENGLIKCLGHSVYATTYTLAIHYWRDNAIFMCAIERASND